MRLLFFVVPLVGLGALIVARRGDRASSPATGGAGGRVPVTAAVLNATLHGGTAEQKQDALSAYQAGKGLPVTGAYTAATRAALVADGIDSPPAARAP